MRTAAVIGLLFLVCMCGENVYKMGELPSKEKFAVALKYYEKGQYSKAKILFESVARLNIIESYADSAQFLLGQCYYYMRDYVFAENEFQLIVNSRPGSRLIPRSKFMIGMCNLKMSPSSSLDQENTLKSINAFELFIDDPAAQFDAELYKEAEKQLQMLYNRLAEKDMKNGMLYKKMGDYNAAIKYLNYAILDYNQYGFVACIPRALYETGECYLKLKQYPEARERFLVVVQNFSDNEYAEKAAKRLSEIKKKVLASRDTTTVIKSFNRIY